jgi:hypothetical protein
MNQPGTSWIKYTRCIIVKITAHIRERRVEEEFLELILPAWDPTFKDQDRNASGHWRQDI